MAKREFREAYDRPGQTLLPELTCAGFDRFAAAGALSAHVHDEAFEICLIKSGSVDWWVGDTVHEVRGGELFITRPAEVHGGEHATMNPCEVYWFHIRLRPGQSAGGHSAKQTDRIRRQLNRFSLRTFKASADTRRLCEMLHAEHRRRDDHAVVAARATLGLLLISVIRDHDAAAGARGRFSPAIAGAIQFIESNDDEPFRIADVAEAVGLNVSHLHKRFAAETGMGPAQWRLRESIRRAKAMLRDGNGVLETAMALQFSSSQYFATAFRRVVGLTPREYCKTVRDSRP